jgi:hypothetical protein
MTRKFITNKPTKLKLQPKDSTLLSDNQVFNLPKGVELIVDDYITEDNGNFKVNLTCYIFKNDVDEIKNPNLGLDFSNKDNTILSIINLALNVYEYTKPQLAYVLATVEHETNGSFQPVKEAYYLGNKAENYRKGLEYYPYYGRGYVQLTWDYNYSKYEKLLGIPLTTNPDLTLVPETSAKILLHGMINGVFTGKSLRAYVNNTKVDFFNARRVVNGIDKAQDIKELADKWLSKL